MKETKCSKGGHRRLSQLVSAGVALGLASWTYGQCKNECGMGDVAEGEPCLVDANGQDVTNGGCNWDPIVFGEASCGTTICGTVSTYDFDVDGDGKLDQIRDLDWYRLSPTELAAADIDGNGVVQIQATLTSEFPGVLFLVGLQGGDPAGCDSSPTFDSANSTPGCGAAGVAQAAVILADNPNGVVVIVSTGDADGGIFDGVECGLGRNDYTLLIECIELPEACAPGSGPCGEPNGTPGCEDPDCCAAVCAADPGCCLFVWDEQCVLAALEAGCAPPANDLCEDAIPLEVPSFTMGTTDGATIDDTFPFCGTAITSPGAWYRVIGTGNTMTASTCSQANYDTKISVYCRSCDEPACVTGLDDTEGCDGFTTEVSWCSRSGEEYLILVHGFGGGTGDFDLDVFDDGVACEPNVDCGPVVPTGACCLTADCFLATAKDCAAQGGDYQGDGVDCGAGDPQISEAAPNIAIPDADPVGVSNTINVPDSIIIGDVNVGLTIIHTYLGDLCVSVEHNGVVVNVIQRPGEDTGEPCHFGGPFGCPENNYAGIVLDDAGAGGSIEAACTANLMSPPNYVPNEALSAFNGMDSSGDWTITVSDNAAADTGTFIAWSLAIQEPSCLPPCPADFDNSGAVDVKDLLFLLGAWGPCPKQGDCPADFDNSGAVDVKDLLFLLGAWGPC